MTRAARWIPAAISIVAISIVTLELTPAEFAELHQLSDRQLRRRFALPRDCDPVLMAMGGHGSRIAVVITCEPERPAVDSDF